MDKVADRVTIHAALRDAPDDALVTGWAADLTDHPNVTYAESLDELRALAANLNEECEGQIDPDYIEDQIRHEGQHAAAARAVGFGKVRLGLGVWRSERLLDGGGRQVTTNWQVFVEHAAPVRAVTKLAYAAIVAAPARLSAGDADALREMRYRDAADVAERISALAARTGVALPMPQSIAGSHRPGLPGPEAGL